ncbi:nucleoside-diphosphate-sugar epimerase [Streptomyces sp. SAI-144]|uniref:NAD-dependent epimerase/dehydratase family protein n=1 Tax=Streptomyces sp. SAI-144 TaxID=2940544 RepID=UPI002473AE96|nr:NAD-dependent epimerase/dehydratase family protein [Streptomyces sp. SAI-144]MDH6435233.1 nucleoside-diphosphate-sugar epimerase [Streptomyces sp. SAI-144]
MITGAAGFVGSQVAREAARRGAELTLMSHRRSPPRPDEGAARTVRADLTDPDSLHGLCDGVDVLLHCASQIGGTPEANQSVNARGTAALVAEARRAGVSRIVYLGTAAVYGRGTYRCARPEDLVRGPRSPTSRTRGEAEDAVLAAGGIVVRPHLVYGRGDDWVVPGLARLLRALSCTPTGWQTEHSVIAVSELAALIVELGLAPYDSLSTCVYHAAYPDPVTASALLQTVAAGMEQPPPPRDLGIVQARDLVAEQTGAAHALDMLATDHWFDSTTIWADLGRAPVLSWDADRPRMKAWYPA